MGTLLLKVQQMTKPMTTEEIKEALNQNATFYRVFNFEYKTTIRRAQRVSHLTLREVKNGNLNLGARVLHSKDGVVMCFPNFWLAYGWALRRGKPIEGPKPLHTTPKFQ